jgi:hypothetical protein
MSRQKHLLARKPGGRLKPTRDPSLLSPIETKRLMDAASAGLRDAVWGTPLGRLHVTGKISAAQFSAGKRWIELSADYSTACQSPLKPRTTQLDAVGGSPADPDSATGQREARRHEKATAAYLEGRHALRLAGIEAERAVNNTCKLDCAPSGFTDWKRCVGDCNHSRRSGAPSEKHARRFCANIVQVFRKEAPVPVRGQFITSTNREAVAKDRIELERERIQEAAAEGRKIFLTADGGRGEFVKQAAPDVVTVKPAIDHAAIIRELSARFQALKAQLTLFRRRAANEFRRRNEDAP